MAHGRFLTWVGLLAVLVLAVLVSGWVRLGIRFSSPCRLFPQKEWVLAQSQPDTFEARLLDRSDGNRRQIDIHRFRRGDLVQFSLEAGIVPGARLAAGENVARFDSYENRRLLEELRPQLAESEANLRAVATGERQEVIALAQSEMAAAEAERDRLAAEAGGVRSLWRQGLVSDVTHDQSEALLRQAEASLEAAHLRVRVAEVGEKDAIVQAWEGRVSLIRQQMEDAARRVEGDRVRCPIAGEVVTPEGDSVLVRVAKMDTLYAVAPVSPSRASALEPGQPAAIRHLGSMGRVLQGWVDRVDRVASTSQGRTFYWVTVAVPNHDGLRVAGIRGTVAFRGERVSLLAWLSDRLRHTADRSLGA